MKSNPFHSRVFTLIICLAGLGLLALGTTRLAFSAPAGTTVANRDTAVTAFTPNRQTDPPDSHPTFNDESCLLCHADTATRLTFPSGEDIRVQVDTAALAASAHGDNLDDPLACQACHQPANDYQYPHPPQAAETLREYEIARSTTCERCHIAPHLTSHPEAEGENAIVCTDCHNSHDVQTAAAWHTDPNVENCNACHEAREVPVSSELATGVVEGGLFAAQTPDRAYCLACHSQPDQTMTFPNGEEVSITIDGDGLHESVHGAENEWDELQCTDCHQEYEYPHEPITAVSYRQYSLNKNNLCQRCHEVQFAKALNSVHSRALEEGNLDAALCTDCHSAHDMPVPNEPRSRISQTCSQCHDQVYDEYQDSVHGAALIDEDNPDVPSCVNCHGVHNIEDPTTAAFRINSPNLCADCHADEELMAQYDVSTDVFETYVADFHGTTALLFSAAGEEGAELNEAVCYDCHGVHDIKRPDDPHAGINRNLLETCQQCHPDASANFPASWTSHYKPSLENNTLVYLVELFYSIVIPITISFFGFLVLVDIYGRFRRRGSRSS